ncbi:MAG: GntR family transcriptional regulator [Acidobacteria bacterium]|nr:GntR family transcriptional regulator [Acidobacteriota bacterium]
MQIRISKQSEVPVRQQLSEQIYFLIATGRLKPGEILPSVRTLARQLKIHHNTVSEAYQDLVQRAWLIRRRGSRLVVGFPKTASPTTDAQDLDDFINASIRVARDRGYSLQELRKKVLKRLLAQLPDHILVVEQEAGLRQLIQQELHTELQWPVAGCSVEDLSRDRNLLIGALVVTPHYALAQVNPLVPKSRPPISLNFSPVDRYKVKIGKLRQPSVIAVVSASEAVLRVARSLFAPAVALGHILSEFMLPLKRPADLSAADLVFCDSLAFSQVKHSRRIHYHLVAQESLTYLADTIQ